MKSLFSTLAVVALCSSMAMAQAGTMGGSTATVATAQADPGGGFMGGPMPRFGGRELFIRTRRGPMMGFRAWGMGSWWMNPETAQRIGLTDQQKQQLEKINQDGQLRMIDLRADLEKQEVILAPMMRTYHPDEAQVLAQVGKVSQARAALEEARVQTMLARRNVLTEEQWNKLQNTRMGFHRTFGPRRGFHHPGGPRMPVQPPTQ